MRFFTGTLSAGQSISISITDGVMFLSAKNDDTTGSCTILGNIPFKNLNPTASTLGAGDGVNLSALSPASPLDGITLTCVTGTTQVILGF